MHVWRWPLTLVIAGALALGAVACGDDDDDGDNGDTDNTPVAGSPTEAGDGGDDEAAVEQAVRDTVAAWNAKDVDTLVTHFTDAGLVSAFGEEDSTPEEIVAGLPEFIGSEPIEIQELTPDVSGDTATTDVTWQLGSTLERVEFTLVNEAEAWLIDAQDELVLEIPDGVTAISVDLNEFAFGFIPTDVTSGNIAFEASNVGEQNHEIGVAKIPEDADLDELLMTEEDVPGFVFLGAAEAAPGEDTSLVFAEPLAPGRYAMVCFLPNTEEGPEGTPHAFLGMATEFTVPTP
jgi:hypothetical protein